MNHAVNDIAAILLQKDLQNTEESQLRKLAEEHPYFAAAQLLLAAKLQQKDDAQFGAQLQKTFLYVQPPLRLQHLLYNTGDAVIEEKAGTISAIPVVTKPPADTASKTILPEELPEQPAEPSLEETELVLDQTTETITVQETTPVITEPEQPPVSEIADNTEPEEEEQLAEDDVLVNPIPGLKIEPIDPARAELNFTPYHTVDYFASLGIRAREEDKPSDKFGRQLKSFTEWIKVMRKLPVSEIGGTDVAAEKKVENLAYDSLSGEHAETEAMAEVWVKQGNITKAIALYDKLSLQDPAKSAYFASKIEELKKKN